MRAFKTLAVATALFSLASCGGGGGGGGTVTPAPSPAPSPGPTPTPTPTNARFNVEAGGPVPGTLFLAVGDNPNGSDVAQFFTDLSGSSLYPVTHSPYFDSVGQTAGFPGFDFSANYALKSFGVENPTRVLRSVTAPRKATTVSPLTSLIQVVGDQPAVKRALGLVPNSNFLLPADLDLTTYSAIRDLASATPTAKPGQVLSANIRVLALQQAVEVFEAAPGAPTSYGMDFSAPLTSNARIANYIKANSAATLATSDGIREFLRYLRAGQAALYRDDVIQAAAALVQNFNLATRFVDDHPEIAPRFSTALMAALRPRLDDLAEQNSAVAASAAVVAPGYLLDEASRYFTDQLPYPTRTFVPVADFFRMNAGGQLKVFKENTPGYVIGGPGARPNMISNDALWIDFGLRYGRPATIRSISVPAAAASAIDATLQVDGAVLVTAKPGFTGIAWYDYVTALDSGEVETGRVYLFIR